MTGAFSLRHGCQGLAVREWRDAVRVGFHPEEAFHPSAS